MLFILKIVRDRVILGNFWTHWVIRNTPLRSVNNLDFSEFRPPSCKLLFILKTMLVILSDGYIVHLATDASLIDLCFLLL